MPLRYEAQIQQALETAPTFSHRGEVVGDAAIDLSMFRVLKYADDYSPVEVDAPNPLEPQPGEVRVPSIADLMILFSEFLVVTKDKYDMSVRPDDMAKTAIHEGQHYDAAMHMRADQGAFGLAVAHISDDPGCKIVWQPFFSPGNWQTTKLGLAAMKARPIDPSDGDLVDLKAMGYEGVEDVADRIRWNNRKLPEAYRLPIPLSAET